MVGERSFTESRNTRAAVIFITIWTLSAIVYAKEGHQQKSAVNIGDPTLQQNSSLGTVIIDTGTTATLEIGERILGWIWKTVVSVVTDAFFVMVKPFVNKWQGNHTCYRNVCFLPEYGLGLEVGGPVSPHEENVTFLFFDNVTSDGIEVNVSTVQEFYQKYEENISKPLVAIVHGLNGSRHSPWAVTLREALFLNVNCNVLVADWKERAAFPYYAKAASSAALVGVLLSELLQKIIQTSNCSLHPSMVHIIGFSLGAHAAGVCGRHFNNYTDFKIGRITGLDPAGPLFEKSSMCLSEDDADFVDVIHTNAGKLSDGRLGLNKSIGHVDFYPNGGSDQPGCTFITDTRDPACSHKRAQFLFIQSVYRNCSFKSFYCEGGWQQFKSGSCSNQTNTSYIGEMGYYSFSKEGMGNQYLKTNDKSPFCIPEKK